MNEMDPERWTQIEKLYHAALELERSKRAAFLREACGADHDLRHEVDFSECHASSWERPDWAWRRSSAWIAVRTSATARRKSVSGIGDLRL